MSMMIDIDSFDFSKIVDYDQAGNAVGNAPEPEVEDQYEEEDESMDWLEDDDTSDLEEEEPSNVEIENDFDALPDDFNFKVAGVELSKADIVAKLNTHKVAAEKEERLEMYSKNFEAIDRQMNEAFIASATENDLKLNNIMNKLRDPALLDSERGLLYRDKEKLERNRDLLNGRVKQHFVEREARDRQMETVRLERTNMQMENKYGKEWVERIGPDISAYVQSTGIASPELRKAISPELLEVLYKAKQFDELEANKKAKLNEVVKKKRAGTAKSTSASGQTKQTKLSKQQAFARAMKSGNASDAFQYLVD